MTKCEHNCTPSCNFGVHSRHGKMATDGTNEAIGCTKHLDEEHQGIAINNGSCEDFHCYEASNADDTYDVLEKSDGTYKISFSVKSAEGYRVQMMFDGIEADSKEAVELIPSILNGKSLKQLFGCVNQSQENDEPFAYRGMVL